MRARLFPHPLLSLVLAVVWLLLVSSLSPNSILFAVLLGVFVPMFTQPYWPGMTRPTRLSAVPGYVLIVLYDIVIANIQVALIVLFKPSSKLQPAWVSVPLEIRTPEAITILAGTITLTPGTVSCDLAEDGHAILVHCLHAPDPDSVRADIKNRYERRLKEIFE
jgi:multicomponent K+:H+ antiporter subunit E